MKSLNLAQKLLVRIGGTAELVAGVGGHYWADASTSKKVPHRPRKCRGNYGKLLMAHFNSNGFQRHRSV